MTWNRVSLIYIIQTTLLACLALEIYWKLEAAFMLYLLRVNIQLPSSMSSVIYMLLPWDILYVKSLRKHLFMTMDDSCILPL